MTTTSAYNPLNPPHFPHWIVAWEAFIKAHERVILIGVASLLLWHFGTKAIDTYKYNRDVAAQTEINKQIAAVHADNQQTQAQLAQMQTAFNNTVITLNAKIEQKKQVTQQQQKIDAQLPLPDLSGRWESLLALSKGSITPQPNGTITVTTDAAHTTVNELERIPQLDEQVADTQTELQACNDLSAKKDVTIDGVKKELAKETEGRAADAKVAEGEKKKSFWKGTKVGSALTVVGIIALKILVKY